MRLTWHGLGIMVPTFPAFLVLCPVLLILEYWRASLATSEMNFCAAKDMRRTLQKMKHKEVSDQPHFIWVDLLRWTKTICRLGVALGLNYTWLSIKNVSLNTAGLNHNFWRSIRAQTMCRYCQNSEQMWCYCSKWQRTSAHVTTVGTGKEGVR